MIKSIASVALLLLAATPSHAQKPLTEYVNPLLGTATLWDRDLGFYADPPDLGRRGLPRIIASQCHGPVNPGHQVS